MAVRIRRFFLTIAAMLTIGGIATVARADCTLGAGSVCNGIACGGEARPGGYAFYNADVKLLEYCDGTTWIAVNAPGSGSGGCTSTMGLQPESKTYFSSDYHVLQVCAGSVWRAMGPIHSTPNNGLVAHWKLDETSGTTAMDSAGVSNGSMINGLSGNDSVNGKIGTALDFDGINDEINAGHDASIGNIFTNEGTISAWIYAKGWGQSSYGRIVDKGTSSSGYLLYVDNNGFNTQVRTFRFIQQFTASDGGWSASTDTISLNEWYHIAVVYNNNSAANDPAFYVNGKPVAAIENNGTPSGSPQADTANDLHIGNIAGGSRTFEGVIDDVRLYDRALSAQEIEDLYASGAFTAITPAMWLPMDDTSGTVVSGTTNDDATWNGSASVDSVAGKFGTALHFDGVDDFVCLDDTGTCNGTDGSSFYGSAFDERAVSLWFNPDNVVTQQVLFQEGGGSNGAVMYISGGSVYGGAWSVSLGWNGAWLSGPINAAAWNHVALSFSASNMELFVNNTSVGSASPGTTMSGHTGDDSLGAMRDDTKFVEGSKTGDGFYYQGAIDDYRVYNSSLGASDVDALFNNDPLPACSSPPGGQGELIYNSDYKVMQYCDGANWVSIGKKPGPPPDPCAGSPSPGNVCADGTVYAGLSPDGNVPMYTTAADAGGIPWNNGNSSGYTTTSVTDAATGEANTTALIGLDSDSGVGGTQPHQAAQLCADSTANGHSDWYLPAKDELNVLYTNKAAIGGFNVSGSYPAGYYWSSSEGASNVALRYRFSSGVWGSAYKYDGLSVRCVRR